MRSPLEQFEIIAYVPIVLPEWLGSLDISINNASLYLFVAILSFTLFFSFGLARPMLYPKRLQLLCEQSYSFIVSMLKQQVGSEGLVYFPLVFTIFFVVLFSNPIGLIPFAFTPTSHLCFTFTIALTCNLAFVVIGFKENGYSFLRVSAPKGSPLWLFPVIVIIEFISYSLRTFSLSIRLFANMMAGHTLLHILSSFVVAFIHAGHLGASVFPFLLIIAVIGLELGIAFIQAYVFTILLCIYLNDAFHSSH